MKHKYQRIAFYVESLDPSRGGMERVTHVLTRELFRRGYELYAVYTKIGGYPAVVLRYLETGSIEEANAELLKIIRLFTNESKRYFEDILDDEVYDNIFSSVARVLVKEKKGFEKDSFSEELQNIVVKDYSSNISKVSVNRAIDWLYSSGIIGFAGKITNCNILEFKPKSRCYFTDLGLTSYFLTHIGCPESAVSGIVNENFVFLDLKQRIIPPAGIALETPAFATMGSGEVDFYLKSLKTQKTYAIEVKTGKNQSRTVQEILDAMNSNIELSLEDLTCIKGVSKELASGILIALEVGRRKGEKSERTITSPDDIYRETYHHAHDEQENFIVIALNGAHEILFSKSVTKGIVNKTLAHPREVFSDAIKARATAIAIVHNHPSGNLEPSDDDISLTKRIRLSGDILGIKVLDHLIISRKGYFSMLEHGMLE